MGEATAGGEAATWREHNAWFLNSGHLPPEQMKKFEAVVGLATLPCCILRPTAGSVRALHWSARGPSPSYPCGSNITSPFIRCHFDSALAINWSIITWAPLTKSPNWASHNTSALGEAIAYPYSNPSTPNSESREL